MSKKHVPAISLVPGCAHPVPISRLYAHLIPISMLCAHLVLDCAHPLVN